MKRRAKSAPVSLEATITELAPGGDGIALATLGGERRAVFVRGAVTGDRIRVEVDASTRPARGRVLELLEAGPARAEPACPYVDRCGGCDWMHVRLDAQRAAHLDHVRAALPRPFREHAIASHAAPAPLGYRTRARLHVRASGGRAIVGMNEARSNDPQEVDACVALAPDLERARLRLAALLEGAHGRGEAQIALGALEAPRLAVLELRWSGPLPAATFARIEAAVAARDWLQGARVFYGEATKPAVIGDPTPWMRGADGAPLRLPPGGFGQPSDEGNALLAKRVAALAAPDLRITELYAGAGNLTVLLAPRARELVAIESSREACDAARANLTARGLHARVVEADAAAHTIATSAQLVVLDPPRKGARDVAARLGASSALKAIIYVSCDAQTLGRDLALLAPAFAPKTIETFELFPQTSHVETVVLLERVRGGGSA
jgi:23S rRNA (uracil1939-C5)-methyltransferase